MVIDQMYLTSKTGRSGASLEAEAVFQVRNEPLDLHTGNSGISSEILYYHNVCRCC